MTSATSHSVFLSPLDQYMPNLYSGLFLVFPAHDPAGAIDDLKAGLQIVNERLPYIKGRVFATEGNNAEGRCGLAVEWSAADANIELETACAAGLGAEGVVLPGMSYEKLKHQNAPLHYFPACLSPLPAWNHLKSDAGYDSDTPVFAANYTLLDGGVVVGLCVHHALMDGTGIAEFIRFWADCTRCRGVLGMPAPDPDELLHRDRLLRLATCPARDWKEDETRPRNLSLGKLLARHPEFVLLSDLMATAGPPAPPPSPMGSSRVFTFDGSKLDAIKTSLRPERITTNTVLCALIWSCITRARTARRAGGLGALSSKLCFTINGRTRLHGGALIDPPFLGNVVLYGLAEVAVEELEHVGLACHAFAGSGFDIALSADCVSPLVPVAKKIGGVVDLVTPEYVANVVELLDQALAARDTIVPRCDSFHAADIIMTSWANMDLYQSDFGAVVGKPEFVRVPEMETDGFVIVLPRKRTAEGHVENGIEVVVAMHPEDIVALKKDAVWCSYLCR